MRLVLKLAYICAKQLAVSLNENHNKRAIYYYGFYILFGSLTKGIILISLSLIFGVLKPALLIVLVFGSLRMLAGGFHFDTFGRCLFVSIGLFMLAAVMVDYTYIYWSISSVIAFIVITFIISLYILIKYAPKDTPSKPITDPVKVIKLKKYSVVFLFLLYVLCSILAVYNLKLYAIAIVFGILLEVFSVSPAGNSLFSKLKTSLNKL